MATELCVSALGAPPSYSHTQSAHHVDEIKQRQAKHRSSEVKVEQRAEWSERLAQVEGHIEVTEAELDAAVKAPASGGVDPTLRLPNELLMMIVVLCVRSGACSRHTAGRVCRRWEEVVGTLSSSMLPMLVYIM
jgi:hypothetical protein